MKRYTIKDSKVKNGILYLSLEPKNNRDKLRFYAGQYATIGFRAPNGRRSPMRCFSIVSSPINNSEIKFAIRLLGKFTHSLSELPLGTEMYVQGPFGEFVVDEKEDTNLVFLAGGIGITPCISMISTLSLKGSPLHMTLLHSNRKSAIPFREDIKALKKINPSLRAYYFVTKDPVPPTEADMLSGMIKEDHIKKVTSGAYSGSTYFVCGPKSFMDSMSELLIKNGADEDKVLTETFAQSSKVYVGEGYSIQKLTYSFASALLILGIVSISYLDLSRYVPRVASADARTNVASPSSSSNNSGSSSSNTNTGSSGITSGSSSSGITSGVSTPSSSNANNNISSGTQSQQTYQAPVTSVS